jgi:hypothetical protein
MVLDETCTYMPSNTVLLYNATNNMDCGAVAYIGVRKMQKDVILDVLSMGLTIIYLYIAD